MPKNVEVALELGRGWNSCKVNAREKPTLA
jgi:hypothetical protein